MTSPVPRVIIPPMPSAFVQAEAAYVQACGSLDDETCAADAHRHDAWREACTQFERAFMTMVAADADAPYAQARAVRCLRVATMKWEAIAVEERFASVFLGPHASPRLVAAGAIALRDVAEAKLGIFDYAGAARAYEALASNGPASDRTMAASNAARLYLVLDERANAAKLRVAGMDAMFARHDLEQWRTSRSSSDARLALESLAGWSKSAPNDPSMMLEPALGIAEVLIATKDAHAIESALKALSLWRAWRAKDPTAAESSPLLVDVADAAFALLDDEIARAFPRRAYSRMSAEQIFGPRDPTTHAFPEFGGAFGGDLTAVRGFESKLDALMTEFRTPTIVAKALARAGTLYDFMRSSLYTCVGKSFDEHIVSANAAASAGVELVKSSFKQRRSGAMEALDREMTRRYAQAVAVGAAAGLVLPAIEAARARLDFFADSATELGVGPKVCFSTHVPACGLQPLLAQTPNPLRPGEFLSYTPGMYAHALPTIVTKHDALPLPTP